MDTLEIGKVSRNEFAKDGGSHVVREDRTQMERRSRERVLVRVRVDLDVCNLKKIQR